MTEESLKSGAFGDPFDSPVCFLFDGGDVFDSVKEFIFFFSVNDVGVDKKSISFRVNSFDENLHSIELACFWELNFVVKVEDEIFVNDAVGSCKESQNILDKELFVIGKFRVPVNKIVC